MAATVVRARPADLPTITHAFVARALGLPGRWLALAVGRSTLPLYAGLDVGDPRWADRRLTTVDELVPAPADPDATFAARLAAALPPSLRARLDPLAPGDDPDAAEAEARRVEAELTVGGLCGVVLGLGPDGHVAFNQPGSDPASPTRLVALEPANLARLGDVAPATAAVTLGLGTLQAASSLLVVAAGPGKGAAVARVLAGVPDPAWPVTLLWGHTRLTVVVADEEA